VIVGRIAKGIAFLVHITCLAGFQFRLVVGVQALALAAVGVIFGGAAAVSTIPTTTAVIIYVVTNLIRFPTGFVTGFVACSGLDIRVFAATF